MVADVTVCIRDGGAVFTESASGGEATLSRLSDAALRGPRPSGVDDARRAVAACSSSDDAPKILFVSKMMAIPKSHVQGALSEPGATGDSNFRLCARLFRTVRKGDRLFVLNSTHDPSDYDANEIDEVVLSDLYLMMGQGMFKVDQVPREICSGRRVGALHFKVGDASSSLECPPFGEMMFQAAAIVKVAIEPENVSDMDALIEGLRLLNRADAFVEVSLTETGEHVVAAGEVHLERCVADLRERFAKVPIRVSPPIISFRETVEGAGRRRRRRRMDA